MNMNLISLFSGAGGMDLGFHMAGFRTLTAIEYNPHICPTYRVNFPDTELIEGDITKVSSDRLPDNIVGIIGGPPCQSWSVAGKMKGIEDSRGRLFLEFIRILRDKQPYFFVAENVKGILSKHHQGIVDNLLKQFDEIGYVTKLRLLNSNDYNVAQTRERVFFVGFRNDIGITDFEFPTPVFSKPTLRDAIWDLQSSAIPAVGRYTSNGEKCPVPNHEFCVDGYSPIFMNRQRLRSWEEPGFTVQASGRQCQLHPSAPKMEKYGKDFRFKPGFEDKYRRMTIREVARIQSFPDDFKFVYTNLDNGYKMIGNAVPVNLAYHIALAIKETLKKHSYI